MLTFVPGVTPEHGERPPKTASPPAWSAPPLKAMIKDAYASVKVHGVCAGAPDRQHDVWLTLPRPEPDGNRPGADATRLMQCRPLRGLAFALPGLRPQEMGLTPPGLLQCRPLRELAFPLRWGSRQHTWG